MNSGSIWLLLDSRGFGGIERHVEILAAELRSRDFESRIVSYDKSPNETWIARLQAAGQPFTVLDGKLRTLIGALRSGKPSILHTHGYKANVFGRVAARLSDTPSVASFHAGLRERFPVGLYQRLDEVTSLLGGRIAVSDAIQQSLPYSTCLIENFISAPPPPLPLPLPRRVAFVGRLNHEKGIDLFCEIARRVGASVEWDVFGDGPLRGEAESCCGRLVQFHGFTPDVSAIWPRIGLLAMPSRAEGLPMAAIEALTHGVPIAAARVGGLPKAVQAGISGWLFDVGDLAGAQAAIEEWFQLDTPKQRKLRLSCWHHATTNYSATEGVEKILEVYSSAARRSRNIRRSSESSHP